MNLSNLSVADLRTLQDQLSKQLKVVAHIDMAKAREEILRKQGVPKLHLPYIVERELSLISQ
jgi:hypothetical protein